MNDLSLYAYDEHDLQYMSTKGIRASFIIPPMDIGDRIKELRQERKLTLQEVGDYVGVNRASVHAWENGTSKPSQERLSGLARLLGSSVEYLVTGKTAKTVQEKTSQFLIRQYDLRLAAGNGHLQWEVTEEEPYSLPRSVFERAKVDPAHAKIVQVQGDSMSPWVDDGWVVMLDTSPSQRIIDGQPYAIAWDGEYYLKRLPRIPGGALQLTSDNPAYAPVIIPATEAPNVQVLGRVFWRGG
ncbi:MAG: LexA family transcriptional regulator [Desulfurellales bacterium]|nr:MAG: LexA family transcriptional regulator [Desulfurellales bacterium]